MMREAIKERLHSKESLSRPRWNIIHPRILQAHKGQAEVQIHAKCFAGGPGKWGSTHRVFPKETCSSADPEPWRRKVNPGPWRHRTGPKRSVTLSVIPTDLSSRNISTSEKDNCVCCDGVGGYGRVREAGDVRVTVCLREWVDFLKALDPA